MKITISEEEIEHEEKSEEIEPEEISEEKSEEITNSEEIINDLMKIFDNSEYAYPLIDVMEELKNLGHSNPGAIITDALHDELLYTDSVEDDGTVYIALVDEED